MLISIEANLSEEYFYFHSVAIYIHVLLSQGRGQQMSLSLLIILYVIFTQANKIMLNQEHLWLYGSIKFRCTHSDTISYQSTRYNVKHDIHRFSAHKIILLWSSLTIMYEIMCLLITLIFSIIYSHLSHLSIMFEIMCLLITLICNFIFTSVTSAPIFLLKNIKFGANSEQF